jgi:hypothetical protein
LPGTGQLPGGIAVRGGDAFMTGLFDGGLGYEQRTRVIIRHQHPHGAMASAS